MCHSANLPISVFASQCETMLQSQGRPCGICGGQSGTGASFLQALWSSLPVIILSELHSHPSSVADKEGSFQPQYQGTQPHLSILYISLEQAVVSPFSELNPDMCIILTFTPLWNRQSLQKIHELFLKPRAVRGKCNFSGDWHVIPHINDDTQRGFIETICTWKSKQQWIVQIWSKICTEMFEKEYTILNVTSCYSRKQIQIQSHCVDIQIAVTDWLNDLLIQQKWPNCRDMQYKIIDEHR